MNEKPCDHHGTTYAGMYCSRCGMAVFSSEAGRTSGRITDRAKL